MNTYCCANPTLCVGMIIFDNKLYTNFFFSFSFSFSFSHALPPSPLKISAAHNQRLEWYQDNRFLQFTFEFFSTDQAHRDASASPTHFRQPHNKTSPHHITTQRNTTPHHHITTTSTSHHNTTHHHIMMRLCCARMPSDLCRAISCSLAVWRECQE